MLGRAGAGIAVVAVVGVGLLGYKAAAGTSNDTVRYRTVIAEAGTITQALTLSGTVHHVSQASASFPTSGTVTAVDVRPGDAVTAGEPLASINATPLQNAVLADNATYTAAIAQYQTDQQTYASSSTTTTSAAKAATKAATTSRPATSSSSSAHGSGSPSGTGTPSGGSSGGPSGGTGATDPTAAVKAATDAIAALQAGVQTVETTLPVFIAQCVPLIPTAPASPQVTVTKTVTATATVTHTATVTVTAEAPSSGSTSSATVSSASKAAATAATTKPKASATTGATVKPAAASTSTPTTSPPVTAACDAAITTLTASNATLPDQMTAANVALAAAVKALDAEAASLDQQAAALAKQQQAAQSAAASSGAAAARSQSSALSATNSSLQSAAAAGLSRSGTGGTVTAATLITDQASIAADDIALAQAQDQLNQATITSPIAGRVASMPFVVGQQASATAAAVVIGSGAIEITDAVPLASRPQVATREAASVTSVVGGTTLQGTISRISLLPTTTSFSLAAAAAAAAAGASNAAATSTTTYATVITVAAGGDALPEGSRVQTTITTKSVDAAVVVPASAVTPISSGAGLVSVVTNGVVSTKRVVTGAVGATEIQIVSGLSAGDTVVIADTTKPIPGASITASRASQNAQGFPGGGGGGGGFTAGGGGAGNGGGGAGNGAGGAGGAGPVGAPPS
jgi:multidrug efflux pump subunit AcrA (membrane-fusion protein)